MVPRQPHSPSLRIVKPFQDPARTLRARLNGAAEGNGEPTERQRAMKEEAARQTGGNLRDAAVCAIVRRDDRVSVLVLDGGDVEESEHPGHGGEDELLGQVLSRACTGI